MQGGQKSTDQEKGGTPYNAEAVCEACGRFGAYCFAGRRLCQECYEGCGSCCPEFGKDDLWEFAGEGNPGGKTKERED